MVADGLKYEDAIALIAKLKENGIYANITTGGVSLDPKISDVEICKKICEEAGAYVDMGNVTLLQAMITERPNERGLL